MAGGAVLAALLIAALLALQMMSVSAGARELARSIEAEERLADAGQALLQEVIAVEAAQRTYLLTAGSAARERAEQAPERVRLGLARLTQAARAVDVPTTRIERLQRAAEERAALVAQTTALAAQGRRSDALEMIARGRGDRLTIEIQSEIRGLLQAANRRRTEALAARDRGEAMAMGLQVLLSLACGVGLGVAAISALHGRVVAQRALASLQEANSKLSAARHEADEANATKSRFLAAASHDMRQPLHALSLYLASLERRVDSPEALRIVSAMDAAVRTMTRMFSALLDLARIEAGVLRPDPVRFRLDDLLLSVADQAREIDPARPGRIRVVRTRLEALSDVDLLEVVVRNLAVNAAKYSAGGRVLVGCRRSGGNVLIQVHDTGPGIPEDQLTRMFGEFVRGETSRSVEGLGLGLSIVDRLSRLLGHSVAVRSLPGRGTVFTVTVPRAGGVRCAAAEAGDRSLTPGVRILLVDDEPLVLDAMGGALADAGAIVATASTGEEAVEAARAGVDLCILDFYLGGENGVEILERIEAALGRRVPCLFVTGSTASGALQALRASGRRWATKPVPAPELTRLAAETIAGPV